MTNNITKAFINAEEIAEFTGCSLSYAYKIIAALNKELKAQNYLCLSGKVSRAYFMKRYNMEVPA